MHELGVVSNTVILQPCPNLNLIIESAGDTSTYEGIPDLLYVCFEEKGNNRPSIGIFPREKTDKEE